MSSNAAVITIAQQKGGAGKSTLTAHLAVALRQRGLRIALIDSDPQGSLRQWHAMRHSRLGDGGGLALESVNGWRVPRVLNDLAARHDIVLIDTPPHIEAEARIAIRAAQLVLVPVQPSPMDLWATRPILDLAQAEKVPALLILNRVLPRATLAQVVLRDIPGLGVPVAETYLGNRVDYAAALVQGHGIGEYDPRGAAAAELNELCAEVLAALPAEFCSRLEQRTTSAA